MKWDGTAVFLLIWGVGMGWTVRLEDQKVASGVGSGEGWEFWSLDGALLVVTPGR